MFFSNGCTQLGRAISSLVELAIEINFTSDSIRIISLSGPFSHLSKAKTYSALLEIMRKTLIRAEDHELFEADFCVENVVTRMLSGEHILDCEIRLILSGSSSPVWYNAKIIRINRSGSFDGRAVLILTDIAHHKEVEARAAELSERVEHDPLTGLYNKKAAHTLIDNFISGEGKNGRHTMLFCDLDDFKSVNDTLGHPFGDALLSNIADKFRSTFRRDDILCRIGGDEFVILMKNTSGRSYVAHRADVLLERMSQAFALGDDNVKTTMSIGIASYPECGSSYSELLRNADNAMYVSKYNGKNQYSFCDNALSGTDRIVRAPEAADSGDSRSSYRTRGKIGDYIFNCLYESTDLDKTLPLVLQLMGTHFSLGRVAIAEIQKSTMVITRQWNTSGVKQLERTIDYTGELRALFESSRSIGHMYLRYNSFDDAPAEVKQKMIAAGIDDVRAFLHCPLLDGGIVRGYIAFFDCQSTRVWSDEERETLSYVARLISLFVFNQQAHQKTLQAYNLTRQLLDGSPVALSFINPDTCELLCINDKAKQDIPQIETGSACPFAPFGSSPSCQKCPMFVWKNNGSQKPCSIESFDNRTKEWLLLNATGITLEDGRDACMCGRLDVSNYRKQLIQLEEENALLRQRLAQLTGQNNDSSGN